MTTIATPVDTPALGASLGRQYAGAGASKSSVVYQKAKRVTDVVLASLLLVLLAPLMLIVAALIKITSRGPVIFRQTRVGLNGKCFTMYKFRTMRNGAEGMRDSLVHMNHHQDGPVFKVPQDPRLTPIGKFLRRSSIDELPQLFNVLTGDMAVVGPRPLWLPEAMSVNGSATMRTCVKPGLTCLWQISGRSELSYDQWVLLDLYYIARRNFMLDLLIIIQTVPAVLSARGAY